MPREIGKVRPHFFKCKNMTKKLSPEQLEANKAAGKRAGRPAFVPTPEHRALVLHLSGLGVPQELIASNIRNGEAIGIAVKTLTEHFAHELEHGTDSANAKVDRVKAAFEHQGKVWSAKVEMQIKADVAELIQAFPSKALNSHKKGSFEGLVEALELKLTQLDRSKSAVQI